MKWPVATGTSYELSSSVSGGSGGAARAGPTPVVPAAPPSSRAGAGSRALAAPLPLVFAARGVAGAGAGARRQHEQQRASQQAIRHERTVRATDVPLFRTCCGARVSRALAIARAAAVAREARHSCREKRRLHAGRSGAISTTGPADVRATNRAAPGGSDAIAPRAGVAPRRTARRAAPAAPAIASYQIARRSSDSRRTRCTKRSAGGGDVAQPFDRGLLERLRSLLDQDVARGAGVAANARDAPRVCARARAPPRWRWTGRAGVHHALARLGARARRLGRGRPPVASSTGHAATASAISPAEPNRSAGAFASARSSVWSCAAPSVARSAVGGGRRLAQVLADEIGAEEGRPARERLEQRRAQRVQVGGGADRRAADLLGRHVRERAQEAARLRLAEVGEVRAAEVAELRVAGGVEEDVRGLHVAVNDAALVRRAQRRQQIQRQPARRGRRQRARWSASRSASVPPGISSNTKRPDAGCAS